MASPQLQSRTCHLTTVALDQGAPSAPLSWFGSLGAREHVSLCWGNIITSSKTSENEAVLIHHSAKIGHPHGGRSKDGQHADWHKTMVFKISTTLRPSGNPCSLFQGQGLPPPNLPPSKCPISLVYDTQPYLMSDWGVETAPFSDHGLGTSRLPVTFQLSEFYNKQTPDTS